MKYITTLILLFAASFVFSQQQVYVEITDTVKTAYNVYYDGWETKGFYHTQKTVKDSIGVDSIRIFKFYYLTPSYGTYIIQDTISVHMARPKKVYMPFSFTENITEPKGKDSRFSNY